eukprot:TRINITY_DN35718_c0_g1_i1.p1 TRINITY_DN35718_c0_g1~~TRINITY_DN35718_c0_g1_i1.p1  ORF type:complete len:863 (+),score=281.07 TRINITY_DN35718_c0_g1_i1:83-2590(+)
MPTSAMLRPHDTPLVELVTAAAAENLSLRTTLEEMRRKVAAADRRVQAAAKRAGDVQRERHDRIAQVEKELRRVRESSTNAQHCATEECTAKDMLARLCDEKERQRLAYESKRREEHRTLEDDAQAAERDSDELAAEGQRFGELLAGVSAVAKSHQQATADSVSRVEHATAAHRDEQGMFRSSEQQLRKELAGISQEAAAARRRAAEAESAFKKALAEIERGTQEATAQLSESLEAEHRPIRLELEERVRELDREAELFAAKCDEMTAEEIQSRLEELQQQAKVYWDRVADERQEHHNLVDVLHQRMREAKEELDLLTGGGEPGPGGAKPQTMCLYTQLQQERGQRVEMTRQRNELRHTLDQHRHRMLLLRAAHTQLATEEAPEGLRWDREGNPVCHGKDVAGNFAKPALPDQREDDASSPHQLAQHTSPTREDQKPAFNPQKFDHPLLPAVPPPEFAKTIGEDPEPDIPSAADLDRMNVELNRLCGTVEHAAGRLQRLEDGVKKMRDPMIREALIAEVQSLLEHQLQEGAEWRQGMLTNTSDPARMRLPKDHTHGLAHATGKGFRKIEDALAVQSHVATVVAACAVVIIVDEARLAAINAAAMAAEIGENLGRQKSRTTPQAPPDQKRERTPPPRLTIDAKQPSSGPPALPDFEGLVPASDMPPAQVPMDVPEVQIDSTFGEADRPAPADQVSPTKKRARAKSTMAGVKKSARKRNQSAFSPRLEAAAAASESDSEVPAERKRRERAVTVGSRAAFRPLLDAPTGSNLGSPSTAGPNTSAHQSRTVSLTPPQPSLDVQRTTSSKPSSEHKELLGIPVTKSVEDASSLLGSLRGK